MTACSGVVCIARWFMLPAPVSPHAAAGARVAPCVDQRFERAAHACDQFVVVDLARQPRMARLMKDRAADREAATCARRGRRLEAVAQLIDRRRQAQQHDAAASRIALGDQRIDRVPLLRRSSARASTIPDRCRGCRAASMRAYDRIVRDCRRRSSARSLRAATRGRSPAPRRRARGSALPARAAIRADDRDDIARGTSPHARAATRSASCRSSGRDRRRAAANPAVPPAGRSTSRVPSPRSTRPGRSDRRSARRCGLRSRELLFRLRDRFARSRPLSCGDARFVGAGLLREIEELVAMIEREAEHFVPLLARAGSRDAGARASHRDRGGACGPGLSSRHRGSSRVRPAWASRARSRDAIRRARRTHSPCARRLRAARRAASRRESPTRTHRPRRAR